MKSYKVLQQVIDLLEEFEQECGDKRLSLSDFSGFLINHLEQKNISVAMQDLRFGTKETNKQELAYQIDNAIGRFLVYLSRYSKSYIKKTLEGTPLQSSEDFTALAILFTHESLTKTELINRNIQEKTSGTEVIRRLISSGLVQEWDDQGDKRSKRISITESGQVLINQLFDEMNYVGKMLSGNLNYGEKLKLHYLLQKLEIFHAQLHEERLINTKEDIRLMTLENIQSGN
ncbi:MAG: winged helix DNA-binding protein [Bacteroidetes bacterium]|nr:winged helix DNA-binding protein [Bacteroidota bacterium]